MSRRRLYCATAAGVLVVIGAPLVVVGLIIASWARAGVLWVAR